MLKGFFLNSSGIICKHVIQIYTTHKRLNRGFITRLSLYIHEKKQSTIFSLYRKHGKNLELDPLWYERIFFVTAFSNLAYIDIRSRITTSDSDRY